MQWGNFSYELECFLDLMQLEPAWLKLVSMPKKIAEIYCSFPQRSSKNLDLGIGRLIQVAQWLIWN